MVLLLLPRRQHEIFPSFTRTSPVITTSFQFRVDPMQCRDQHNIQKHSNDLLLHNYYVNRMTEKVEMLSLSQCELKLCLRAQNNEWHATAILIVTLSVTLRDEDDNVRWNELTVRLEDFMVISFWGRQ